MDTDEAALIERCRAGDLAAFEPLVEKYRQRVYRLAYNVLRDPEEAWDVAQDGFIRAFQALPSFRGDSAFYTWLFRIVMNVARDRARQHAARGRAFGTERVDEEDWDRILVDQGTAPDANAAQVEERERIGRALATLSEPHRAIIMLSDLEGLSYREIAEVLDIPMGTVMSRLHNARRRLREALGPLLLLILALLLALAWPRSPARSDRPVRHAGRSGHRRAAAQRAEPARRSRPTSGSRRSCRSCVSSSATTSTPRSSAIAPRCRWARRSDGRCRATAGSRSRRRACAAARSASTCG